jgi:ABC-2 type transport system ATP-binding protein
LPIEEVRLWPGVSAATREDQWLDIEAPLAEPVLRRLLDSDPAVRDLEVRKTGLAEAFVRITREAA